MDKGWNPLIILYRNFTFLGLFLKIAKVGKSGRTPLKQ